MTKRKFLRVVLGLLWLLVLAARASADFGEEPGSAYRGHRVWFPFVQAWGGLKEDQPEWPKDCKGDVCIQGREELR